MLHITSAQGTPQIETFELDTPSSAMSHWYFPTYILETDSKRVVQLGLRLAYEDTNQHRNHHMRLFTSSAMDAPYFLFDVINTGLNSPLDLTFNVRVASDNVEAFGLVLAVHEDMSYEALQWVNIGTGFSVAFVSCPFALSYLRSINECQVSPLTMAPMRFDQWRLIHLSYSQPNLTIALANGDVATLEVASSDPGLKRQIGFYVQGQPEALLDFDDVSGMIYEATSTNPLDSDEERRRQIGLLNIRLVAAMEMLQEPRDCVRFDTLSKQLLDAQTSYWRGKAQQDFVMGLTNSLMGYGPCYRDYGYNGSLEDICKSIGLLRTRDVQMESNLFTALPVIKDLCPNL